MLLNLHQNLIHSIVYLISLNRFGPIAKIGHGNGPPIWDEIFQIGYNFFKVWKLENSYFGIKYLLINLHLNTLKATTFGKNVFCTYMARKQ